MQSLVFLEWSKITLGMYLSAGGWLYLQACEAKL